MLKLTGTVLNVFQTPVGTRQDGTKYGGEYSVQIQSSNLLKNGESRIELVNLRTTKPKEFSGRSGKEIIIDVGVFAKGGSLVYFLPEHFEIQECKASTKGLGL